MFTVIPSIAVDAHRVPRLRSRVRYEKVMRVRTSENREVRQVAARLPERTLSVETGMRRWKMKKGEAARGKQANFRTAWTD